MTSHPRNILQEWVQHNISPLISTQYIVYQTGLLQHAPEFLAIVIIAEKEYGRGTGKNKKEAEKAAAENALARIRIL
jgi:ribonuclease-3